MLDSEKDVEHILDAIKENPMVIDQMGFDEVEDLEVLKAEIVDAYPLSDAKVFEEEISEELDAEIEKTVARLRELENEKQSLEEKLEKLKAKKGGKKYKISIPVTAIASVGFDFVLYADEDELKIVKEDLKNGKIDFSFDWQEQNEEVISDTWSEEYELLEVEIKKIVKGV